MVTAGEIFFACHASDLSEGKPKVVTIGGEKVLLLKMGGDVHAVSAFCPHRRAPLVACILNETRREVICPRHRFRYSVENGACVASTDRPALPVYDVKQEEGRIFVNLA